MSSFDTNFLPIQGRTLSSQIVAQVRDALFRGDLKPGDALGSEAGLAANFNVSRMSMRDALRSLEAMGIVEIKMGAGGGARVAQGSTERVTNAVAVQIALLGVSIDDVLQAQSAIESMAAELAARNADPSDLKLLADILSEAEGHLDDPVQATRLGMEFHVAVAQASHNEVLRFQLEALRHVMWGPGNPGTANANGRQILSIHRAIFNRIKEGDSEGARQLMGQHLQSLLERHGGSGKAAGDLKNAGGFCCAAA